MTEQRTFVDEQKPLSSLERELQRFTWQGIEIPPSFALADLVMMQMAGNFDTFLAVLSSDEEKRYEQATTMIDATRQQVTSAKLFPAIVQKTIESQFGEPFVAVRELAQNALDAYDLNDIERTVVFSTETKTSEEQENFAKTLKVHDTGVGMDTETLIRDLLIPYNSGKEFDLHKIGEHGIGWYSVMDLAELVKVTTQKRGSKKISSALIYRDAEQWRMLLWTSAQLSEEHQRKNYGTEVVVHFNTEQRDGFLRQKLYKHTGMVDPERTKIRFNDEEINTLAASYQKIATEIVVAGKKEQLQFAVSKRRLEGEEDSRFIERDAQMQDIVYTQQGLFVNYLFPGFAERSIHNELYSNLTAGGLDFWVELPAAVKLTKGRNNILPEYSAAVLDGLYKGFEQLFLDVILNDKEIIEQSRSLQESIARLFNKNYAKTVRESEKKEFGLFRRVSARTADVTNKSLDWIVHAATEAYRNIPEMGKAAIDGVVEKKRKIAFVSGVGIGTVIGASGMAYGAYKIYEHFGWTPFLYAGGAAGTIVGVGLGYAGVKKITGMVADISEDFQSNDGDVSSWDTVKPLLNQIRMYLLHKMGLYVNVEEKRQRKQEKERQRIAKKYLSRMAKDDFFDKILHKKIIPATHYSSEYVSEEEKERQSIEQNGHDTIRDVLATTGVVEKEKSGDDYWNPWRSEDSLQKDRKYRLQAKAVKLSIDDLVDVYLSQHLKYQKVAQSHMPLPYNGDYVVDYNHPVVRTVVDRLEELGNTVTEKYDVRIMEDYLTFAWDVLGEGAMFFYCLSGAVFIHAALRSQNAKSLLERSSLFQKLDRWYSKSGGKEKLRQAGAETVRYALQIPITFTKEAGKAFYDYGELCKIHDLSSLSDDN